MNNDLHRFLPALGNDLLYWRIKDVRYGVELSIHGSYRSKWFRRVILRKPRKETWLITYTIDIEEFMEDPEKAIRAVGWKLKKYLDGQMYLWRLEHGE